MRIAVYAGSFDPLHIGHQAIMEYLTGCSSFDWVYLVISPQNPFKDPSKALSAERRYRDAIAAVRRHPQLHVWVDDIELSMDPPHYTIRTLDALRQREPGNIGAVQEYPSLTFSLSTRPLLAPSHPFPLKTIRRK